MTKKKGEMEKLKDEVIIMEEELGISVSHHKNNSPSMEQEEIDRIVEDALHLDTILEKEEDDNYI